MGPGAGMNCLRCGQEFAGNFCPRCGTPAAAAPVPRTCARCGTGYVGNFCPMCGQPALPPPIVVARERWAWLKEILAVVWLLAVVAYAAIVLLNLGFLAAASAQILPGILAQNPQGCPAPSGDRVPCAGNLFLISPVPLPVGGGWRVIFRGLPLVGLPLLAWFLFVLGAIAASHLLLLRREGRRTVEEVRRALARLRPPLEAPSGWSALAQVAAALFFFDALYLSILLPLVGIEPRGPSNEGMEPWFLLYGLANAPVYEELVTRVLYLGLLVGLLALLLAVGGRPRRRPWWAYPLGGGFRVDALTLGPLLYSSTLFALAHVLGGGWEAWKVVDTFVAGLALGYLFLRFGLAASILLHFTVDYFAAGSLMLQGSPGAQLGLALLLLVVIAAGAAFFVLYARRALLLGLRALGWSPPPRPAVEYVRVLPPPVPAPAPAVGYPPPGPPPGPARGPDGPGMAFRCPRCGWPEARYEAGHLICTRCGSRL